MRSVWNLWACAAAGLLGAVATVSCGGVEFISGQAAGGASAQGGGGAGDPVRAGGNGGGGSSSGGGAPTTGDSGSSPNGGAGMGGEAGESVTGEAGALGCGTLRGAEFGGHCYVDATLESTTQPQAVATCAQLATRAKASGHLLVLESEEEQSFVLRRFLVPFTDLSDAWLGLTCSELDQPDINACYCAGCSKAMLSEKQQNWRWSNGAASTFGWVNSNPNESFRCAALGYNPEYTIWGWVDRPCDKATLSPISGHPHDYRTICELEL